MKKNIHYLVFPVSLVLFLSLIQIKNYIELRPQSIHIWRQTDCLSITQNYYQRGSSFCEPEIYNQISDGGFSGKSAGEFPALYYVVAQLWKLFGKHEWIYRVFTLLILSFGCLALYTISYGMTKNYFFSVFLSFILFTSPTIAFYSISFLTNVPSLAFILIAWLFIYYFYSTKKNRFLWISMFFFSLAMLLKVTAGISFVALVGWWFIESFFSKNNNKLFKDGLKQLVPFIAALIPVVIWYRYAENYNSMHGGKYTFNGIWPIWEMTRESLKHTYENVSKIWIKEYFNGPFQLLTLIVWIFLLTRYKKIRPFFYYLLWVLPIGSIIYLLLWFQALESHDYYLINLIFVVIVVWGTFIFTYYKTKWLNNKIIPTLFIVYLLFLGYYCRTRLENRFGGWMNEWYETNLQAVGELEPILDSLNVRANDKVISIPDFSINATLYYMNRRGFTDFGSDFTKTETYYKRIEQGAKYLIINDSTILSNEYIKPFICNKIGEYKNVLIYNIEGIKPGE